MEELSCVLPVIMLVEISGIWTPSSGTKFLVLLRYFPKSVVSLLDSELGYLFQPFLGKQTAIASVFSLAD